jgi:hypothetical protein
MDVSPIVDLCHFGVPDWIGSFQNPDFPRLFAGGDGTGCAAITPATRRLRRAADR